MEAVIYSITTKDGLYIGSTTNFKNRCYKHKYSLKSGKLFLLYENIRKNNGEYKIEIILDLVCEDKTELRQIEEEYRISCKANLNSWSAFNTEDEKLEKFINYQRNYKQINKEDILSKKKSYYQINKDLILKKIDCECGGKHTVGNKARHNKSLRHQTYLSSL